LPRGIASYEQSLAIFRALGNLGLAYEQRDPKKARELWRESLAKQHPDSPDYQKVSAWPPDH